MSPELEWLNSFRQKDIELTNRARKLYAEDKPNGVPWMQLTDKERDYYSSVITEYDKAHVAVDGFTDPSQVFHGRPLTAQEKQINEAVRKRLWE